MCDTRPTKRYTILVSNSIVKTALNKLLARTCELIEHYSVCILIRQVLAWFRYKLSYLVDKRVILLKLHQTETENQSSSANMQIFNCIDFQFKLDDIEKKNFISHF